MPRNITLLVLMVFALCAGGSIPVLAAETVVPVSLVCSEVVNQIPTLYFTDAAYQSFGIELTGEVPGDIFAGQLVVTSSMGRL